MPGAVLGHHLLYAQRQGVPVKRVPLAADMSVDLDTLAAAIGPDVGMVQIGTPNTPTGMVLDVPAGVTVLIDQACNEQTDRPEWRSVAGLVAAVASYNDEAFTRYSLFQVVEAREMILDAVRCALPGRGRCRRPPTSSMRRRPTPPRCATGWPNATS